METTLSVFFGMDKTYIAMTAPGDKGLQLQYVNAISQTVRGEQEYLEALTSMESFLPEIAKKASRLVMTLPIENVFVHQFPSVENKEVSRVQRLLEFELKHSYPHHTVEDFSTSMYPMTKRTNGAAMMLALMMEKKYMMACEFVLGVAGLPVDAVYASQFAAHAALLYNYPEYEEQTAMVLGVQDQFLDVSVMKAGETVYYNLLPMQNTSDFAEICEKEVEKLLSGYVAYIDVALAYGSGLNKSMLDSCVGVVSAPVQRLNPFRMTTAAALSPEQRVFCQKSAHLFPACIGSALPNPMEKNKIVLA